MQMKCTLPDRLKAQSCRKHVSRNRSNSTSPPCFGVGLIRLIAQAAAAESVIQESLHRLAFGGIYGPVELISVAGFVLRLGLVEEDRHERQCPGKQVGGIGFVVASGSGSEKFGYYRRNPIAVGRQHRFLRSLAFPEIFAGQERVEEVDELRPDLVPGESLLFPVPSVPEFFEASDDGVL